MNFSSLSTKLLYDLTEENYAHTFTCYRLWIELGAAREHMPNVKLYNDILGGMKPDFIQASYEEIRGSNMRPDWINPFAAYGPDVPRDITGHFAGKLIHDNVHLLLRFISEAEPDPVLSTYAIGLHDRLCRETLEEFFKQSLSYMPDRRQVYAHLKSQHFCEFYTKVNLIAHWVNLGHVRLEDVRDHILQFLTFHATIHPHQLNSLMILLKISGATFAACVDPSVMDRCCNFLKPENLVGKLVAAGLAEVSTPILATEKMMDSGDYRRF